MLTALLLAHAPLMQARATARRSGVASVAAGISRGTGVTSIEQWSAPEGGTLIGMSRTVADGATKEFEFVMIRKGSGRAAGVRGEAVGPGRGHLHRDPRVGQRGGLRESAARFPDTHHLSTQRRRQPARRHRRDLGTVSTKRIEYPYVSADLRSAADSADTLARPPAVACEVCGLSPHRVRHPRAVLRPNRRR